MAGLKFLNALRQRSNRTCSLSSVSMGSSAGLEDNICSLSHSSFSKVYKHSPRYSSVSAFCVITEQRSRSYRETALGRGKKNSLVKYGNHIKNDHISNHE